MQLMKNWREKKIFKYFFFISETFFTFVISIKNKHKMEQKKALNLINLFNSEGKRHGYWEYYHYNGNLFYKGNYVNDKRDGYWEYYHSNGNLSYKGNFVNGNKHGYWEEYHSDGNLSYKGNYVDGERHGYWEYYYYNGNSYKGNYVDGERHGYWEEYDYNGNLFYKGFYDMGKRVNYNPDEPKQIELTLDEIASKFGINVNQLKIKK